MKTIEPIMDPAGRLLLAAIFLMSGVGKTGAIEGTQQYMQAFGLPGVLIYPTIAFEVFVGAAFVVGWQTRAAALLLAGFSLLSALIFHTDFGNQMQMLMFLKNLAIAGGFLMAYRLGAGAYSLDRRMAD